MHSNGKVALITGASRGIGRAIAERLARDAVSLVINYYPDPQGLEEARAKEVVQTIERSGSKAIAAPADVTDGEQIHALFDLAEKHFGGLDIVVHNAATWRMKPIAEATVEDFDVIFATNTRAAFVTMHEAARRLHHGGRVVMISAGLTLMPRPTTGIYGASKAAIDHLVRVLAHELGPKQITVNSVLPGAVNTDALKVAGPEFIAGEVAATALGRVGEPSDIADIVAFLVSSDARWITGQRIGAGGGMF